MEPMTSVRGKSTSSTGDRLDGEFGKITDEAQAETIRELVMAAVVLLQHAEAIAGITTAAWEDGRAAQAAAHALDDQLALARATISEWNGTDVAPDDLRRAVAVLMAP